MQEGAYFMPFANHGHCFYLKIIATVLTILTVCFTTTGVAQAADGNSIGLRLVDVGNSPVARVNLSAWQVNAPSESYGVRLDFSSG
jgi:hypothetical protein